MIKKTLEKKIDLILNDLEAIEIEAMTASDKLAAQKFLWERKVKKLQNIGYNVDYIFEEILD